MNGSDYNNTMPSQSCPRIVLSPNGHVEGQYNAQQRQPVRAHKHQHSRGSSTSSLQIPRPTYHDVRPDTPESLQDPVDPQTLASLQQQYLDLLATNQYLYQLQQQQHYNVTQQYQQMPFLSPPRTPISGF